MIKLDTSFKIGCLLVLIISFYSCESFVDVEIPNDRITGLTVFENDQTALDALDGLYSQLFNTNFAAGGNRSVSFLSGLSADNFELTSTTAQLQEFFSHQISPDNSFNLDLWSGAYQTIYAANAILEGTENSSNLSEETRNQLNGGAKFVRAFAYFYLVELYHNIPLILTTDYSINATIESSDASTIFNQIVEDLNESLSLLDEIYINNERTSANSYAAMALLARVYLFQGDWEQAEYYSNQVIMATGTYELLPDLNNIFLPNSREAIWQISPAGWGGSFRHTREGNLYIMTSFNSSSVVFSENFLSIWDTNDLRFQSWIGSFEYENSIYYYPFKYKVQYDNTAGEIPEYSMVLRLPEQYLIRAEAQMRMGNIQNAIRDLNILRNRANTSLIDTQEISEDQMMEFILLEYRREYFSEWGHRWLSLKRSYSTSETSSFWSQWDTINLFYPIPDAERMKNPNLVQNDGY